MMVLSCFETPEAVFLASESERKKSGLFRQETLKFLTQNDTSLVQADLDWMQTDGCHILTLIDKGYPEQLKTIIDPPPVLYVRGDVACLSKPQLAIVGSRIRLGKLFANGEVPIQNSEISAPLVEI
jgi:DNA processing protein